MGERDAKGRASVTRLLIGMALGALLTVLWAMWDDWREERHAFRLRVRL